ncbi:MAG TPA: hypothetical protein VN445_14875 [Rectinemataceae bacterium]|nr:hypothetical protein [Rectinemataceae bacterium]
MQKRILAIIVFCLAVASLFGFEISVPNEIPDYKNLEVRLTTDAGAGLAQARFYFLEKGEEIPLYAEFTEKDGVWSTLIPFKYLRGEEFSFYTQVQTKQGKFLRSPASGYQKARLLHDITPPSAKLKTPEEAVLAKGKEQLVVFDIKEDSEIADFEILYDDEPLSEAAVYQNTLYFLVTPSKAQKDKKATVIVSMVDLYNNKSRETFVFALGKEAEPFFSAEAKGAASLDVEYTLAMGESANTTDLGVFFADVQHDVTLDYSLGGETKLKGGPFALELGLELSDTISVFDIPEAYPNSFIADYQNIMNMWNPWNFANEFDYTGEEPRKFYNYNTMSARFSILDPALAYAFGDQKISFQSETIKDFEFRGSSLALDIPLLELSVAKGLSDLGLYETAWPQNFFGLQAGLNIFDYFWLQTNLSFISSLQGRYDDIAASGVSPIGALYHLGSVRPEENLVFGLGTGTDNGLFTLTAGLGLTLYVDDASQIIDKDQLASDINDSFDFDISPYLGYVDTINSIFPVFDYFPLSWGLASKAVNRELWGVSYGADLEVEAIGLTGWFHKTDGTYKSLGASVDSDEMDLGGAWEMNIGDFNVALGYDWLKDNIPDILFTDILPLIIPSMASTAEPTENDIQNITHTAEFSIDTPTSSIFANVSLDYTFEYATTNAAQLAAETTDASTKTAIENSMMNDTTMTHTAALQVKSGRIKLGSMIFTLGAKTEDSYVTYALVDGAADGSSIWEFSYGIDTSVQLDRYKLSLAFDHAWSTAAASDVEMGMETKFFITKGFLDKITLEGSYDQLFNSAVMQQYAFGGGFTLEKAFGVLDTSIDLQVDFVDSLVDNTDDALTAALTVSGGISL